ncbi:MAG: hypothetical protein ACJ71Z_00835 [Aeromicrobium sp.]
MTHQLTPREASSLSVDLPAGTDERVSGYGVIGLPFSSGHYLALRDFVASSFGPAYRAVWHRDPAGAWSIYSTNEASESCPRYLSAALWRPTIVTPIDVTWLDDFQLRVYIDDALDWTIEARPTMATRLMTAMGRRMPPAAWTNQVVLDVMGRMAGPMLGAGKMRLAGGLPNGQTFSAAPQRIWGVTASSAIVEGRDAGPIGPLPKQDHLADFWLPQRGIFFADGFGHFESFDPDRHLRPLGAQPIEPSGAS